MAGVVGLGAIESGYYFMLNYNLYGYMATNGRGSATIN